MNNAASWSRWTVVQNILQKKLIRYFKAKKKEANQSLGLSHIELYFYLLKTKDKNSHKQ